MAYQLAVAAVAPVVSTAEAKLFLRVDGEEEDATIAALVAAASQFVELYTGRSICPQTWDLFLDEFADTMLIGKGPVSAVLSVNYRDADGNEQLVDPADWSADLVSDPAWVVRNAAASWPGSLAAVNAVRIRFTAGYASVPPALRQAVLLLTGHWFANREAVNVGNIASEVPLGFAELLVNFRSYAD